MSRILQALVSLSTRAFVSRPNDLVFAGIAVYDGPMTLMIVIFSLLLGSAAGFIMHRSDFCIAGLFRDLFLFRSFTMLRVLLLLVVVSMVLFEISRLAGLLEVPFPLFGPPSLVNLIGGALFGVGMVLAGGCVVGTLYKMGAGSLPSLLAFVGLLLGSVLYAEIHPRWALLARRLTLAPEVTLPQMLGISPTWPVVFCATLGGAWCWRWFRAGLLHQPAFAEGYLQPWKAAGLLALLGLGSALLVGMPFGITTSYAKIGGFFESLLFPGHFATLVYFQAEPLQFVHPLTGLELRGGAGPRLDGVALAQFPVIAGIVLGAAWSAARLGEWHFHLCVPIRQCLWALIGGIVMGLASRMAPACNVWHLMGGLPVLAGQSLLFVAGLFPGAWLGGKLLTRYSI